MSQIILLDEDLNIELKDIDSQNWVSVLTESFPNFTNHVKTARMKGFFERKDIVMITHDLFTEDMGLNLIGTALYSGDEEEAIAGKIAFVKEIVTHDFETDLVGLDTEGADNDVKESLIRFCEYMKKQINEVER